MPAACIDYTDIRFRHARADDDHRLRWLLSENELYAWVRLSFEREPSYFTGEALMGEACTVIAEGRDSADSAMGMYNCAFLPVYVDGRVETVGYLGGLRIASAYRRRIRYVRHGYDSIRQLAPDHATLPYWMTSIAVENNAARRLLEAGLARLPRYRPVGRMRTFAIAVRKARSLDLLKPASAADVDELVAFHATQARGFQLAPVLEKTWLLALDGRHGLSLQDFLIWRVDGRIQACVALWDQRAFKQTVVRGYRKPLDRLRRVYNTLARIGRWPELPAAGRPIEQLYLAFLAIDGGRLGQLPSIIRHALHLAAGRDARIAVLGLSLDNPLCDLVQRHFRAWRYDTCIEAVVWPGQDCEALPQGLVQPEVAVL